MSAPQIAPRDVPCGDFGVSVADVNSLILDVAIPDDADPDAPADTASMTVTVVQGYIRRISSEIAGRFYDIARITDEPRRRSISGTLELAVMNLAASYVEASTHPAVDGVNSSTYSAVLAARGNLMLDNLLIQLKLWLADGDGQTAGGGAAHSFPLCPRFPDGMIF